METFVNFISGFSIQTILSFFAIGWYYRREIRAEIKEIREETKLYREDIKVQSARIDKLHELFAEERKEFDKKFYELLNAKKT